MYELSCEYVDSVIVVSELREFSLDLEAVCQTVSVAMGRNLCVLDR